MPEIAVRLEGLTKSFGGHRAVDEVSLSIPAQGCTCIIGPNGAGKTTLFNLISGQLKATAGQVFLGAREITALPAHERARLGMGRSFQLDSIFPNLSVYENVRLAVQARWATGAGLLPAPREEGAQRERVEQALAMVHLAAKAGRPARVLSHGEKRQLDLAMVLAQDPQVILLDEPTAGMAEEEVPSILAILAAIKAERRRTIILVEHKMDLILSLADSIAVMVYGRLLTHDVPAQVMANPQVQSAYLGEVAV